MPKDVDYQLVLKFLKEEAKQLQPLSLHKAAQAGSMAKLGKAWQSLSNSLLSCFMHLDCTNGVVVFKCYWLLLMYFALEVQEQGHTISVRLLLKAGADKACVL